MKIVKVQVSQMIAASPGYGSTTGAIEGNLSREDEVFFTDDEFEF